MGHVKRSHKEMVTFVINLVSARWKQSHALAKWLLACAARTWGQSASLTLSRSTTHPACSVAVAATTAAFAAAATVGLPVSQQPASQPARVYETVASSRTRSRYRFVG
jgi:hypothetical protein